jgi:hypothetical protein
VQAKLAEEAERYEDMVQNVKSLAELKVQLNVEVRIALQFPRCIVHSLPDVVKGQIAYIFGDYGVTFGVVLQSYFPAFLSSSPNGFAFCQPPVEISYI